MQDADNTKRLIQLEGDVEQIGSSVKRIEDAIHKGSPADRRSGDADRGSMSSWVGTIATVFAVIGAFAMTVISPIKDDIQYIKEIYEIDRSKSRDQIFELGRQTSELLELQSEVDGLFTYIQSGGKDIDELSAKIESLKSKVAVLEEKSRLEGARLSEIIEVLVADSATHRSIIAQNLRDFEDRLTDFSNRLARIEQQLKINNQ